MSTDKAVSKPENGCGLPDVSSPRNHEWTGLLILDEGETSASAMVYDKPLIHYLLSYFLLVGITAVDIQTDPKEYEYIRSLKLEQYGLDISFSRRAHANTMVVFDKALVFGADLTRTFQSYMAAENTDILPVIDDMEVPVAFLRNFTDTSAIPKTAERRTMPRGMICLSMRTKEDVQDAAEFVRVYQKYHGVKIADLREIAGKRKIIP